MPEERLRVSGGAYLVFRHPSLRRRLNITHGASEIKWSYALNTVTTPTYGGEVVQILSCYVGPMTITGQTANNDELGRIYDWFLDYMNEAGKGDRRDERAVIMDYPERGWSFKLQITQLQGFQVGTTLLGTPWTIQAEVVNDDDRQMLVEHTMNALNKPLFDKTLRQVGFNAKDPTIDPTASINQTYDASTIGDNMQTLLSAWSSGDFAHWGFDALRDPSTQFSQSAKDYWMTLFGTNYIAGEPTHGGGSDTLGDIGNPMSEGAIVAAINKAFEAKNIPGKLGVAVAAHESGLDPNRVQVGCTTGSCGIGLFQVNGDGSGRDSSLEVKRAGQHRNTPGAITKYYPSGSQIAAAANWFSSYRQSDLGEWAADAQGPADHAGYAAAIRQALPAAQRLIEKYKDFVPTVQLSGTPKHIIDTYVIPTARATGMATGITPAMVEAANAAHGTTVNGTRSDHQGPPSYAWAADMSNGSSPTPAMDNLAKTLATMFGLPWKGSGVTEVTRNGYRLQMLYRTNVGGNHYNHVHFGVRKA